MVIQLQEKSPVFPIILYLHGGKSGVHVAEHKVEWDGLTIMHFQCLEVGLSKQDAEAFLNRPEPLAWALAAFMKPRRGRVWLKFECLARIVTSNLDDVQKFLLTDCVQTGIQLKKREETEFQYLVQEKGSLEMKSLATTWSGKLKEAGETKGSQTIVEMQLRARFGQISEKALNRLHTITAPEKLADLAIRLLTAQSVHELGLE